MRILIATATAGGGHLQAAAALEEAWRLMRPRDHVQRLDILDFTPKLYRTAYSEGYVRIAERAPELYAHAFRKTDNLRFIQKIARLRRMSARLLTGRFIRHLKRFNPDAVLCPHFLPIEAMGSLAGHLSGNRRPLTICVVTDFEAHALWMEPCIDLYCVAAPETKARLVARGVNAGKVLVTGIPVSQRFSKPLNVPALQKRFKLKPGLSTLLVVGGGMGMGPLTETVQQLDKAKQDIQLLVVAGKNESLYRELKTRPFKHATEVFGFVTNMQELMAVSDIIVTKPGGLTSSEALAIGKPLLIVNPLPGQEAANSDFMLERGSAAKVNRLEDLPYRIDQLIRSKKLKKMARAAKRLGRPKAAIDICRAVAARIKE